MPNWLLNMEVVCFVEPTGNTSYEIKSRRFAESCYSKSAHKVVHSQPCDHDIRISLCGITAGYKLQQSYGHHKTTKYPHRQMNKLAIPCEA